VKIGYYASIKLTKNQQLTYSVSVTC